MYIENSRLLSGASSVGFTVIVYMLKSGDNLVVCVNHFNRIKGYRTSC